MIEMGGANSKTTKKKKPQVILDFPPKTSAVNAVQRIILGKCCYGGGNIAVSWYSPSPTHHPPQKKICFCFFFFRFHHSCGSAQSIPSH